MRLSFFILCLAFCHLSCSNSNKSVELTDMEVELKLNAFPGNPYASVIAYKMDGENKDIVNKQNKLSSAVVGKGLSLTKKQEETLLSIYRDKKSYGDDFYRCFDPHLGFVFYDTSGEIVAHSTVCFQCNWMRTSPDIGAFIFSRSGAKSLSQLEGDIFEL